MSELAPIVLFVYSRPWHTEQTLTALKQNTLAKNSLLYIFADGPRNDSPELLENIRKTREVIHREQWCGEVIIREFSENRGLAGSIQSGVTEVVSAHGRVVVLEDDIVTSPGFLTYMNDALDVWKDDEKVMHISGYMYPLQLSMPDTVFLNIVTPWGWATWQRAWKKFNPNAGELLDQLKRDPGFNQDDYNHRYGREFYNQLLANVAGTLRTWAVKWHTVIFLNRGYSLHPGQTLTQNIGFDGSGENCGVEVSTVVPTLAQQVKVDRIALMERKDVLDAFAAFYQRTVAHIVPVRPSLLQRTRIFFKTLIKG